MSVQTAYGIGCLVRPINSRLGIGKLVSYSANECIVEFFHSVARRECRPFDPRRLKAAVLARQTRCYVRDEETERWVAGRIGSRDAQNYEVNFPDRRFRWIAEADIFVRCNAPCEDPTETLVLKSHETALFHGPRHALMKALVRQRAVSRGMTGLTSAKIELYAHQVEVARRVLQDPVQRYLLADEVGLGKTIEAGILIRQFLLDEQEGHVLVVVPPLLEEQWRMELGKRFDAFHGDRVAVISTTQVSDFAIQREYRMVVMDEAHHVAAGARSPDRDVRRVFEACRRLAHRADRLILLSATPAANNEAQFLAMLHLLDPRNFDLGDLESFRERVRMRQDIGRVLLSVTEAARPYSLKLNLPKLGQLFPSDTRLAELSASVLQAIEANPQDAQSRAPHIRAIRTHVSETYRLHRRMLRNRRGAIADAVLNRADQPLVELRDASDECERLDEALDEWRAIVALAKRRARDQETDENGLAGMEEIFLLFAQFADGSPHLLEHAIRWRLSGDDSVLRPLREDASADVLEYARRSPLVDGEEAALMQLLSAAQESSAGASRMQTLQRLLWEQRSRAGTRQPPRSVVFTNFSDTARRLADRLEIAFGRGRVARHITGMAQAEVEQAVTNFRVSHDCFVLVCDRSAEEGRNLQFADQLVHFDLPWQPNRLEQRIGRLDRIGRVRDLTSYVMLGRDATDSFQEAWFRLMRDGLDVFKASIASLQFYVDAKREHFVDLAFRSGAEQLMKAAESVRPEVDAERERIQEQAAIDEIDASDENAARFFRALDESDATYSKLQTAVEEWLCNTLQFTRQQVGTAKAILKYAPADRTLLPSDILKERFIPHLQRPGTYDRAVASQRTDTILFRIGSGLIDALAEHISWDDRGQAFAIWRESPDWDPREGSEWVGFRFDLLIEPDVSPVLRELSTLAPGATPQSLKRRADALFPPRMETIFVDARLGEVVDTAMLERLRRPFSKYASAHGRDHNLTKHRLGAMSELVPDSGWEPFCREARDAALRLLRERASFRDRCDELAELAARKLGVQLEQLRLRQSASTSTAATELRLEETLMQALLAGIRAPAVRVDAVGFLVISGRGPIPKPAPEAEAEQHA